MSGEKGGSKTQLDSYPSDAAGDMVMFHSCVDEVMGDLCVCLVKPNKSQVAFTHLCLLHQLVEYTRVFQAPSKSWEATVWTALSMFVLDHVFSHNCGLDREENL